MKHNCLSCGTKMQERLENTKYEEAGLNVTLLDVTVYQCPNCGERELDIPKIEELHRSIAFVIARKKESLTPKEIRFLRKYLGLSSVDFAAKVSVDKGTVSHWESEGSGRPMSDERIDTSHARESRLRFAADKSGWREAASAPAP